MSDWARALDVAREAAREAGALLLRDFHRPSGPRGGGDKAEADVEAEEAIRGRLISTFPGWTYQGEETGRREGERGAPVFLVDPNDATRDYLVGRRGSAVSIAVVHEGRPVLGVVFAFGYPDDRGTLYEWAEGGPVRRNGSEVGVDLPPGLGPHEVVLVSSKGSRQAGPNLRCAAPARIRSLPSIAHRLALVAAGEAAAATSLFHPRDWDFAAGHALVRGAGGTLVDDAGVAIAYDARGTADARTAFGAGPAVAALLAGRPWASVLGAAAGERLAHLEPGRAVADPGLLSRAQGCLLGQIAGDNLGALVEFERGAEIRDRYPDGPRALADGGPHEVIAGQPTDDGEMALALARSIIAGGAYDPAAARAAYLAWLRSSPFDVGTATRAALDGAPREDSQGNGALMRASPLAIYAHARPADEAARLAAEDAALTHPHVVCRDASAAFVVAAAHAIRHGDGAEAAWRAGVEHARARRASPEVLRALEGSRDRAPACDAGSIGWVLVALQNAFHVLLRASGVEDGVVETVRRGGDTDTNAAVAGALLGAVHGRDAVPLQWRSMILSCHLLPGHAPRPRPPAFWPVDAYEVAERLVLAGVA